MSSLLAHSARRLRLHPPAPSPRGEGEQDLKVPLPMREGFRVRAVRSLAKVTYSQ
jgi:hypothetical protein